MQIDHSSPVPLYQQIENYVRKLIESGEYDEGKLLPKEEDLAKRFGVSRNTVRQGMYKLVLEGLLIRKKGVGTMVAPQTITTHLDKWHSFTEEMSKRGVRLKNYQVDAHFETADAELTEIFQLPQGTSLLKLERLRGDDKEPFVYFISWFHPRVGLTEEEAFGERPLYEILEKDHSVYPARSNEELKAIVADHEIADRLNVATGTPVLYRKRRVYDAGNRLLEYNIGFYCGDKFSYSIDIRREEQ